MSTGFYRHYKESGFPWLGAVPSHWELLPFKRVARLVTERADEKTFPVALENVEGWTGRFVEGEGDYSAEGMRFCAGDILFGKLRPYLAKAWLADTSGEAVGDFHVLRCRQGMVPAYLQRFLLTQQVISLINSSSFGAKMPRASWDFIGAVMAVRPPIEEQQAIAAFLDRETAKIDALVAEQERLLALLAEKRQAVISRAVTQGLDPSVPLKDSGVEWLGRVPAHWSVTSLNGARAPGSTITYGIVQAGPDVEGGVPYIRTSDMSGSNLAIEGYLRTTFEIAEAYDRSRVEEGDLVVAIRATVGKTLIVPSKLAGANLTQGTAKVSPDKSVVAEFLYRVLNSALAQQQFSAVSKGVTFKEITLETLRKFKVPRPSVAEQLKIVAHLEASLAVLDNLTNEAMQASKLLRERRAALISAAVTGKIDVRGLVAAREPEALESTREAA